MVLLALISPCIAKLQKESLVKKNTPNRTPISLHAATIMHTVFLVKVVDSGTQSYNLLSLPLSLDVHGSLEYDVPSEILAASRAFLLISAKRTLNQHLDVSKLGFPDSFAFDRLSA